MTDRPGFDRILTAWLDEQAPMSEPAGLLERVTTKIATTRRLPGWAILERWLPMQTTARLGPGSRAVIILALLGFLIASLAAIGVGAQPSPRPDSEPAPPFGLARNGLIAFDSGGDIWVADPDGSDPRFLVSGPGFDIDPTFSPDGTKLAFWSLEAREGSTVIIDDSPDDSTVSRLISEGTATLLVSDVDGTEASEPRALATGLQLDDIGGPPSWSPTSDALAYGYIEDPASKVIDIVEVAAAEPRRVASGDGPSWSPDGGRLAYRTPTYPLGVMVVGVDGSDPHTITTMHGAGYAFAFPQWSPDGQTIAFYDGNDGEHDIRTVAADGSAEPLVSDAPEDEYWPYWSPDGTRLAFGKSSGSTVQLVVANALDGWSPTTVESGHLTTGAPIVWSPDGRRLVGFLFDPYDPEFRGIALLDVGDPATVDPTVIDVSTPWFSASWQRLAP